MFSFLTQQRAGLAAPERARSNTSEAKFTTKSAAAAIRRLSEISKQLERLDAEQMKAKAAWQKAQDAWTAENQRISEARLALEQTRCSASDARSFLLGSSRPSAEEDRLLEQAKDLLWQAGRKQGEYQIHSSRMAPPKENGVVKQLAAVVQDIAAAKAEIIFAERQEPSKPLDYLPARARLSRLLGERERLEPQVKIIHSNYEKWHEIQTLKQRAQQITEERERLKSEREEAVIAKALAAK